MSDFVTKIKVRGEEYDIRDAGAARIDSPEFTGVPLAPTADADTDSPQIATTAFVQRAVKDKFGKPGGIAILDENGKVPTSQLPSYVDDVLEGTYDEENNQFLDTDGNIYTPESDKIYVDVNTNTTYRWSGTLYIKIGGGSDEVPDDVVYINPDEASSDLPDIDAVTSAKYVSYNNADSNLEATNVQDAIDELKESIGSGSGETVNIVDNLESISADSALSANQGRVLKENIDEVNTYLQREPSKNLLKITLDSGFSELGVTFTVNEDKSLTLSGTRTTFTKDQTIGKANLKAGVEYILSGCPKGGSGSTYRLMIHNDKNPSTGASDIGEGVVFTVPSDGEYIISTILAVSYTYDGITYYPMIREATVENDTYEPYYEDAMSMANYLNDNALVHGDVVDHLESTATDLPLSANQGRVLSDMIIIGRQFRFKDFYMRSSGKLYIRFPHTSNYLPGGFAAYKASGPGNVAAALFARTTNSYSANAPGFVVPLVTYEGCTFSKVSMDRPYFFINITTSGSLSLWLDDTFDYYIGDNPTASDAVWTTVR